MSFFSSGEWIGEEKILNKIIKRIVSFFTTQVFIPYFWTLSTTCPAEQSLEFWFCNIGKCCIHISGVVNWETVLTGNCRAREMLHHTETCIRFLTVLPTWSSYSSDSWCLNNARHSTHCSNMFGSIKKRVRP